MGIEVGSILDGKVTGITKFGAFVSLPGNRSGLVHISEIAYTYVNDVHDLLSEGQEVKVKVIGIDESNRINLSIKQAQPRPERRSGPRPAGDHRAPRADAERGRPSSDRYRPPQNFVPEPAQPRGPASFEDQLKQFMQSSDSKLSEHHMNERQRGTRRGRK